MVPHPLRGSSWSFNAATGSLTSTPVSETLRVLGESELTIDLASPRVRLDPGEILIRRGEADDTVYVLVSGCLSVSRSVSADRNLIAIIDAPGAVIGEMVALGGGVRSVTVTATEPSELVAFTSREFQSMLEDHPELATELAELSLRRAEEAELAAILSKRYGIEDDEALRSTCHTVAWRRLEQGEVLFKEGDASDAVYIVVRGRLMAGRREGDHEVRIGDAGRGEVVGELGVIGQAPRSATLTALRDTVIARLDASEFHALVSRQPVLMYQLLLRAVDRAEDQSRHSTPHTIVSVAISSRFDAESILKVVKHEMDRHGRSYRLWPERVDALLDTEGVFDSERGTIGDVRVSRLVNDFELETELLVVELGRRRGPWSRRALGIGDHLLVVTPADPTDAELHDLDDLLADAPPGLHRTVVIVRNPGSTPEGSAILRDRFSATDVLNVEAGSDADLARIARVAVGRGMTLVMGGGGGRGFAHLGVMRAMTELGIPIDVVGGTSIGGVMAAVVADAMTPDEAVEWAHTYFPRVLDYTIPFVSLVKAKRILRAGTETWKEREIEDLWRTCFMVSTNLTASRVHVHRRGNVATAIRATTAIPGVMPPVPMGDELLIDGGVLDNLPIDIGREVSPGGVLIASDVTPPGGPVASRDYGLFVSGWKALRARLRRKDHGFPGISSVLMRSMITASMRERQRQLTTGMADFYLELDIHGVSMLEFGDPLSVARRGYEAAMPVLTAWLEERPELAR